MIIKDKDPLSVQVRRDWLSNAGHDARSLLIAKFQAGEVQHGCDIGAVDVAKLIDEMLCEALDQVCYVLELKRRIQNAGVSAIKQHQ